MTTILKRQSAAARSWTLAVVGVAAVALAVAGCGGSSGSEQATSYGAPSPSATAPAAAPADNESGGASIALFPRSEQQEAVELREPGDGPLPVLVVDSVDEVVERVREHVVSGPLDRKDWGGRVAYVRDPDGNLVEIASPAGPG